MAMSWDSLPECEHYIDGVACYAFEGKGAIVYPDYKTCAQNEMLLPGFSLLPDYILAGELLPRVLPLCCYPCACQC